jgi:hypothetical protein
MSNRIAGILFAGSLILLTTGCSPYPAKISDFKKVVHSWEIEGRTAADAIKVFEEKGFSASQHKAEKYFEDQRDYVYATQSKLTFIICAREWRVIAKLENGSVAEIESHIFFNCI